MKKFVIYGALALACMSVPAMAAIIEGPVALTQLEGGWNYSGVVFYAKRDSGLLAFTFNSQGKADTVILYDGFSIVHSLAVDAGESTTTHNVSWDLTPGKLYYLLRSTSYNTRFEHYTGPINPENEDIRLAQTGYFATTVGGPFNGFGGTRFWSTFTNLVTEDRSVVPPTGPIPEPATWVMLIIGFGAVGGASRASRRRLPHMHVSR